MPRPRITDEEALQALTSLQEKGTYDAAARSLGLSRTSFQRRLEAGRKLKNDTPDVQGRVKTLEKIIDQQRALLEKSSGRRKPVRRPATSTKGGFVRVIVPDTHGSHVDQSALNAMLSDIQSLRPKEVILLGDHLDCGGFLAQHHTLGYVAETKNSFADDVLAANEFLDNLQDVAPHAEIHYLEGNHERRIEQWCVTQALKNGNPKDAEYLASVFSTAGVLRLQDRGIHFYKQGECYDGLRIPATIKRGRCYFTHGTRCGVHAAKQTLSDFGGNVVFGHTHRIQSHQGWTVGGGDIAAWNVGFLAQVQPYWRHNSATGWSHGYGVQFVKDEGEFLHLTVPIINSRSYLTSLANKCR